jgi:catechol 2,3-dioxygenase-like lactoylglutathione lyase family enzyme
VLGQAIASDDIGRAHVAPLGDAGRAQFVPSADVGRAHVPPPADAGRAQVAEPADDLAPRGRLAQHDWQAQQDHLTVDGGDSRGELKTPGDDTCDWAVGASDFEAYAARGEDVAAPVVASGVAFELSLRPTVDERLNVAPTGLDEAIPHAGTRGASNVASLAGPQRADIAPATASHPTTAGTSTETSARDGGGTGGIKAMGSGSGRSWINSGRGPGLELQPMVHVEDMAASIEFYQHLGAEVVHGDRDADWVLLQLGTTQIGLLAHPPELAAGECAVELNFAAAMPLDVLVEKLRRDGVTVAGIASHRDLGVQLHVRTPDGLLIKIYQREPDLYP